MSEHTNGKVLTAFEFAVMPGLVVLMAVSGVWAALGKALFWWTGL